MSKTANNILETEPTNALYGKFRPLESKNGALKVDVDMSGETDGLASETTLSALNVKVSKGIDNTLAEVQQNLLYGREDATTARALKVNSDGELNTEISIQDVEKTAPAVFPENPTNKSLKVVPMLRNGANNSYVFQKTQEDSNGLLQSSHPLPVDLPHGITYGLGSTAQERSFAFKVKDNDNGEQGEQIFDVNNTNKERVDTTTNLKLNIQQYAVDNTNTNQLQSLRTDGANKLLIKNNENNVIDNSDNITSAQAIQNLGINNANPTNFISQRISARGISNMGTYNTTPPLLNNGDHTEFQVDSAGNLKNSDVNITKGQDVKGVGEGLQQVLIYGRKPDGTLQPLETLGDRLLVDVLELTASGRITTSNALSSVQVCGYNTTDNQFKTLLTEQDGTLHIKNTDLFTQSGTATPAESQTAPLFYNGLHDDANNLMRTAKCNEFGEQLVEDLRGSYNATTGFTLNTTLGGGITKTKQITMMGSDNPASATQLNAVKIDNTGLLYTNIDKRDATPSSDHSVNDERQEVYVAGRVSAGSTTKLLQMDTDGSLLVKNLASSTFQPLRSNFTNYNTSINPATNTTFWNNSNVANDATNKFRWFDMTASYNFLDAFFNFHQGTNQPNPMPYPFTLTQPLVDKNNVPIVQEDMGVATTEGCIVQIVSSDAPFDVSATTIYDLQGRVNYSEQVFLKQDVLNTDGLSRNFVGSFHGYIPNQYFFFLFRCMNSTIGTAPTQNIRMCFSARS